MAEQLTIFGGPGCGKTTRLLALVERELESGVAPRDIVYTSFTRKAALEAMDRACTKFTMRRQDFRWFSTLHSIAYQAASLDSSQVMQNEHFEELAKKVGFGDAISKQYERDDFWRGNRFGDRIIFAEQLARARGVPYATTALEQEVNLSSVEYWARTLTAFKKDVLFDFADMIAMAPTAKRLPRPRVLFVDEAQDLSPTQWKLVEALAHHAERVYFGGDDDQAIYQWAGASVDLFLDIADRGAKEILPVSHRLPDNVFNACNNIVNRIRRRQAKTWRSAGHGGRVQMLASFSNYIRTLDFGKENGTWAFLARNKRQLKPIVEELQMRGLPYFDQGKSSLDTRAVAATRAFVFLQKGEPVAASDVEVLNSRLPKDALDRRCTTQNAPDAFVTREILQSQYGYRCFDHNWFDVLTIKPSEQRYLREVRRKGYKLTDTPHITVSTIHSIKGGEADNVVLDTTMSKLSYESLQDRHLADGEHRVFYVGASRTKKNLYIANDGSPYSYPRFW